MVGDVDGKAAILVDDMIDTAGTLVRGGAGAARVGRDARVRRRDARRVLRARRSSGSRAPEIEEIVVTDTIPLPRDAPDKIKVLSVADILARSIRSIFTDGSVSELFAGENQLFKDQPSRVSSSGPARAAGPLLVTSRGSDRRNPPHPGPVGALRAGDRPVKSWITGRRHFGP